MMRPIHFGLVLPAGTATREQRTTFIADLNRALHLVAGHFDSAWMIDHLQPDTTDLLESFTTISYLAALHPQIRFGQTVVCQSFRNPALLAKIGATLQFLSGGRFILGLGAGWHADEYRAYGYDFPPAGVRVAQLEETIQIVRAMWTQEKATFQGTYYRVIEASCAPRPDLLPPLIIGAFKPKMLRLTAQQIIAQMHAFIALGIDSFLLDCGGFPNLTTLELLIAEVLPAVVEQAPGE